MTTLRERLLRRAVLGCLRVTDAVRRRNDRIAAAAEAAALAGLGDASLNALTAALYDRRGAPCGEPLFDWEEQWFAAELPPPPARLLIGGAGAGREVLPLLSLGYEILAFDPAPKVVAIAEQSFAGVTNVEFVTGSYEDMAVRRPGALGDALARRGRFDAVVFGWGSFTHIVGEIVRTDSLIRARELCPVGPALLSVWIRGDNVETRRDGRSERLGAALGGISGRGRSREIGVGDSVVGHAGYCHAFTWFELDLLAAKAGYAVHGSSRDQGDAVYPHITLRPRA